MYTRVTSQYRVLIVLAALLALTACTTSQPTPVASEPPTPVSVAPTTIAPPTSKPPTMTARPAPETPAVTEVLTITQAAQPLQGDIPGILAKPLENPSEWVIADDVMSVFPMFAWRCENPGLTSLSGPTPEANALAAMVNDRAKFEQAVNDLEAKGYVVFVSKTLVFNDAFGSLPIGQTVECVVQQALGLFGEAPKSLPDEIGMVSVQRTGAVDGEAARERMWFVVWQDKPN